MQTGQATQQTSMEPTEEERMWEFLQSTMASGNTPDMPTPPELGPVAIEPTVAQNTSSAPGQLNASSNTLAEDDDLGDAFSMYFNLNSDEAQTVPDGDLGGKVQLPRSHSLSSSQGVADISPGDFLSHPSMSPATINWLQSLAKSTSSDSLSGLVSPAQLVTPNLSAGGESVSGSAGGVVSSENVSSSGLARTPSSDIIDWKAYNEAVGGLDKGQREGGKWRVIPQQGPHADPATAANASVHHPSGVPQAPRTAPNKTEPIKEEATGGDGTYFSRPFQSLRSTVVSFVGQFALNEEPQDIPRDASVPLITPTTFGDGSETLQSSNTDAIERRQEEKNKRKAIISPEYVQYGRTSDAPEDLSKPEVGQFATSVPDPTGRRPSKKSLHQTTVTSTVNVRDDDVRCKCTGRCRNARCACVKAGMVCGAQCKCVECANPFEPMQQEGIDTVKMTQDVCLMQHLSKIKDMRDLLRSYVTIDCCKRQVQVVEAAENGFICPDCGTKYTYSWCNHKLCPDEKKPRKHCSKCRRCVDHRNEHCDKCNHCYFAGVANSFACSCESDSANGKVVPNVPVIKEDVRRGNGDRGADGGEKDEGCPVQ